MTGRPPESACCQFLNMAHFQGIADLYLLTLLELQIQTSHSCIQAVAVFVEVIVGLRIHTEVVEEPVSWENKAKFPVQRCTEDFQEEPLGANLEGLYWFELKNYYYWCWS